jgi:hypothetical protein
VFVLLRLVTVVRTWCTYSFDQLNFLGTLLRLTYAMAAVYLDFGIQQINNPFFCSLTRRSMEQVHPTRARKNDTWDRRRIVNNTS